MIKTNAVKEKFLFAYLLIEDFYLNSMCSLICCIVHLFVQPFKVKGENVNFYLPDYCGKSC